MLYGIQEKDTLNQLINGGLFMLIIYNSFLYRYIKNKNHIEIVTYDKNKVDKSFKLDDDIYYKDVLLDDPKIQDIFDVQFFLNWDSHLKDVDKRWEILTDGEYMKGNHVLLRFVNGFLPGWTIEEQVVCSKYVDIDECEDFSVVYTYKVKNGKRLETPVVEEQKVSKEEFQKLVLQYRINNI